MSLITAGLGQAQLIITRGLGAGEILIAVPLGCVFVKNNPPLDMLNDRNSVSVINNGLLSVENDQSTYVVNTQVAYVQRCNC